MMVGKEDLGLSLSLGSMETHSPVQLNLVPSPFQLLHQKTNWSHLLASARDRRGAAAEEAARPSLRGIDVNRAPAAERESDEEAGVSSPNSTLSSLSGKRCDRDIAHRILGGGGGGEDNDMERASSRGNSDEEDAEGARKKLRLSKDQSVILEESFKEHSTLNPKQKQALAKQLNLRPRQVEVWFQNRRARTKLKQTEVDCEFLKRCCENLTEENRRLQKEVAELRALKLSPQFYMHMTPPTTLTMCPSCERVAVSNNNNNNNNSNSAARTPAQPAAPLAGAPQHHQRPWAPVPMRASFMDVVHHPQH